MKNINAEITNRFQLMKSQFEESIHDGISEFLILKLNDSIYLPIKEQLEPLKDILNDFGNRSIKKKSEIENSVSKIKSLLDKNPLERELQYEMQKLMTIVGHYQVKIELAIEKPNTKAGRIDLIAYSNSFPNILFELKRCTINFISKKNPNNLTKPFVNAIKQINTYGLSEVHFKNVLPEKDLKAYNKRLVMGRRMKIEGEYALILKMEKENQSLKIYSWDAWISEFERIYT